MQDGGTGAGAQHGGAGREANLIFVFPPNVYVGPPGRGDFLVSNFGNDRCCAHCCQSQCGGMSAAGESGLRIVTATCAGGSAHSPRWTTCSSKQSPKLWASRARSPPLTGAAGEHGNVLHSAERDMRALNEGPGLTQLGHCRVEISQRTVSNHGVMCYH
jgi:hypothetical protein